ncbi:Na(+)-translocating NADH-quinone reductase subunit A [Labilibaculum sp. DW002]|uniref:Na(+)-translocating NADH-quinone reductase subunit A n=1 Tax=Paralabilibaculum antarcticum TaxID=2912572 RepID=A0ABT5VRM0_9BACT|nr:Na(+)-translocating NADH-quinone reductase subunit A [Labilibaculum sp. DW002]MDE5418043.1 Na(+)-translocating NADH-quinone reductase subunit A [Labilibaculum sp. DW002]
MSEVKKIKKGLDIKLIGKAEKVLEKADRSETFAIKPTDFPGLTPKLKVKVDTEVKAGSALFFDKYRPEINFTSPVSGKVVAVNRGERRKILEVVIQADAAIQYQEFKKADPNSLSREEVKEEMLKSGLWAYVRQRPYDVIAKPQDTPKAIFVSAFDTAPLAADIDFLLEGEAEAFQAGLDALAKLTDGKVHLNINPNINQSKTFSDAKNVVVNQFTGIHPAGNVGVQIHELSPINKGDVVWVIRPQEILFIGRLFQNGTYDVSRKVALTGSEVKNPAYYSTILGGSVRNILKAQLKDDDKIRVISGNVLTGTQIPEDGFLGFYDSQITVIPEGDEYEFLGWALPGLKKFSMSKTFFSWLTPNKEYRLDANLHGEHRAFVMTGEYDKVLPMDVLPLQLIKSIMVEDIDQMEQLGIYEVAPEDLALCEFVCTSKINVQDLVRQGIDLMVKEMS